MKKIQIVTPFLFAIYPIISLWSVNIEYIPYSDILSPLFSSVLITIILLLIVWLALKNGEKGALIVSGILFLFYFYGYVSNGVKSFDWFGNPHQVVVILGPSWLGLSILWVWLVVKRIKNLSNINLSFIWFGSAILVISLIKIIGYYIFPSDVEKPLGAEEIQFQNGLHWQGESQPPDIYYIILDGYGREDSLLDLYHYDNSEFIEFLSEKGFFIASQSSSNYNQTALSLASSLNMQYINYFEDILGKKSGNRKPLIDLIRHSTVRQILEANGYQVASTQSGYEHTEIEDAAIFYRVDENRDFKNTDVKTPNTFEWLLYETTGFQGVFDAVYIFSRTDSEDQHIQEAAFQYRRIQILNAFDHLDDVATLSGNYFVFVHIVAPHPTFVFNQNGDKVTHFGGLTNAEGSHLIHGREDLREKYIAGYIGQLQFINSKTMEAIDHILEKSENPPVIILQSDHGPGAYLDWESLENSNVAERLSILNAIYFPDGNYGSLYPSITPVNIFRVLLNTYFGGELKILEDRSYFSSWKNPYNFIDVTDRLQK